jgi:hypothetical protein
MLAVIKYDVEYPERLVKWRNDCVKSSPATYVEGEMLPAMNAMVIEYALTRIERWVRKNEGKATLLTISYWVTMIAFLLNMGVSLHFLGFPYLR